MITAGDGTDKGAGVSGLGGAVVTGAAGGCIGSSGAGATAGSGWLAVGVAAFGAGVGWSGFAGLGLGSLPRELEEPPAGTGGVSPASCLFSGIPPSPSVASASTSRNENYKCVRCTCT